MGDCPLMLSELIGKAMHLILAYGDMPVVLDGNVREVLECVEQNMRRSQSRSM